MSHQNETALWRSLSKFWVQSKLQNLNSPMPTTRCQALLLVQTAKPATSVVLHHLQWHQLAVCIDKAQTRGLATVPAADPSRQSVLWNHRKKSTPITFLSPTEHQKTMYYVTRNLQPTTRRIGFYNLFTFIHDRNNSRQRNFMVRWLVHLIAAWVIWLKVEDCRARRTQIQNMWSN